MADTAVVDSTPPVDTGSDDTGTPDDTGSPADSGSDSGADTAMDDTGAADSGSTDSGPTDTGTDTGPTDSCPTTTLSLGGAAAPGTVWAGGAGATLTATAALTPSGTVTYAWSLITKPSGSTATVTGTTASVSFKPDIPGAYTVRVTASAACTADKTADINVTAVDAPVFYESLDDFNSTTHLGGTTLRIAGATADPAVSGSTLLPTFINAASTADTGSYSYHASFAWDTWEPAAPGTPSRAVFAWYTGSSAGPNTSQRALYAATSDSRDSPAAKRPIILVAPITDSGAPATDGQTVKLAQPRFSPDGSRVAYLKIPSSKDVKLATIGFDTSSPRDLTSYFSSIPAGAVDGTNTSRPQWLSNTVLGWARTVDASNWEVVTANDSASVTPTKFFSCGGALPRNFAFITSGGTTRVLVSNNRPTNTGTGDLILYESLAGTCNVVANISKLGASSYVHDFTLSPDKTKVAYIIKSGGSGTTGGTVEQSVYIANADGSGTPTKLTFTKPVGNAGPRYVAGGARLVLTLDGEPSTFPLAGTPIHTLQTKSAGTTLSHAGNGACSMGGDPKTFALVGLAYAAALVLARRGRKDEDVEN